MSNGYNLYNLEASFKEWLIAGIKNRRNDAKKRETGETTRKGLTNISIKNYLSDFRHFWGWLTFYLKSNNLGTIHKLSLVKLITSKTIFDYKSYLIENNIPTKTVNRRLSTLRKFCSFCISQGWMKENPAKKISNIKYQIANIENGQILNQFQQDLLKENLDQKTITNYLDDIQEFLSI